MKLLKIPLNESQLEDGKTQIGEIQRKVECVRTLNDFMKIVTKETDPDELNTDACIQENITAANKPKEKEGEDNKSFFHRYLHPRRTKTPFFNIFIHNIYTEYDKQIDKPN